MTKPAYNGFRRRQHLKMDGDLTDKSNGNGASLISLPEEVLDIIIRYLWHHKGESKNCDVLSLSMVCRALRAYSYKHLFNNFTTIAVDDLEGLTGNKPWPLKNYKIDTSSLIETLSNWTVSPGLFTFYTKSLEIVGDNFSVFQNLHLFPSLTSLKLLGPIPRFKERLSELKPSNCSLKEIAFPLGDESTLSLIDTIFNLSAVKDLTLFIDISELLILIGNHEKIFDSLKIANSLFQGISHLKIISNGCSFPFQWLSFTSDLLFGLQNLESISIRTVPSTCYKEPDSNLSLPINYNGLKNFFDNLSDKPKLKKLQMDLNTIFRYSTPIKEDAFFNCNLEILELVETAIICPFSREQIQKLHRIMKFLPNLKTFCLFYGSHSENVTFDLVLLSIKMLFNNLNHPSIKEVILEQAWNRFDEFLKERLLLMSKDLWIKSPRYREPHVFTVKGNRLEIDQGYDPKTLENSCSLHHEFWTNEKCRMKMSKISFIHPTKEYNDKVKGTQEKRTQERLKRLQGL